MRETIDEKADRLLMSQRVRVLRVGDRTVVRVEGDHGIYAVVGDECEPLTCSCPAGERHVRCSHLIAAELVTLER